jgi:hypothetical protein
MSESPYPEVRERSGPLNRRSTPKELKKVISRLNKRLRKEERRAEKVRELKKLIATLSAQVTGYRNDPELR